jgi:tRNA(Ile)-lysidine synthase
MSIREQVLGELRQGGVVPPNARVLVLLSGGADSVCLVHALNELLVGGALVALHVDHGLREAAVEDERFCAELCERVGVRLVVERVAIDERGNLEAAAREARYAAAERVRQREGLDWIATGHTASDQVETILYRLAASPGRRALLGMEARSGRLIRPLLDVDRARTRAYCRDAGLGWREDETNLDRRFARNRLRHEVVPELREIHPAAEQNVLATADALREEAALLERAVEEAVERLATGGPSPALDGARLRELEPALRRLVLRTVAERALRRPLALRARQVGEIEKLALRGGSGSLDLGGGLRVISEYGLLRFSTADESGTPEAAELDVPGRCRFGDWELVCELREDGAPLGAWSETLDEASLDADTLAQPLLVRAWRRGDRMRPLGLGGSKSVQDLLSDRKVPRSLRRRLPVVESAGEIAWIAGVAVSETFKVTETTARVARIRASSAE